MVYSQVLKKSLYFDCMILFLKQAELIITDIILEIINFPLWWYGVGLKRVISVAITTIKQVWVNLDFYNLPHNLSTPMFGRYGLINRIFSTMVVLLILIGRLGRFVVTALGCFIILFLWLGLWPISLLIIVW